MDQTTGEIMLSELDVEVGVYHGHLPVMLTGRVRLACTGQVGNPNSWHHHLIRGQDCNGVTGYICACGEAFLGFTDAHDHFFNLYRGPTNFVYNDESVDEANLNVTNTLPGANSIAGGNDIANSTTNSEAKLPSHNVDVQGKGNGVDQGGMQFKPEVSAKGSDAHNSLNDDDDEDEEDLDESDEPMGGYGNGHHNRHVKPTRKRLLVEAIFILYGYPSSAKYIKLLAEEHDISEKSFRALIWTVKRRKSIENPYKNYLTKEIFSDAKKLHARISSQIEDKATVEQGEYASSFRRNKNQKPARRRLLAEAVFILFGLPKNDNYISMLAKKLDITFKGLQRYILDAFRRKSDVSDIQKNPYKKHFTGKLFSEAKEMHAEISEKIARDSEELEAKVRLICKKHGSLNPKYRKILAGKLSMQLKKLEALYKEAVAFPKKMNLQLVKPDVRQAAETLDASIVSELQQMNPPVKPTGKDYAIIRAKYIMEAMWEKHGLEYSREFRDKYAEELNVPVYTAQTWWRNACIDFEIMKKSCYHAQLTDEIREEAEKIHTSVMESMGGNPGTSEKGFANKEAQDRLVVEGIFKLYGTHLAKNLRNECATRQGVGLAVFDRYWLHAKTRNELGQNNPFEHLLTKAVLKESKCLYAKATAELKKSDETDHESMDE